MKYSKSEKPEYNTFAYSVPLYITVSYTDVCNNTANKRQSSALSWNIHYKGPENVASLIPKVLNDKINKNTHNMGERVKFNEGLKVRRK